MLMLMHLQFPNEPFSTYVKDGSIGPKIMKIMEAVKPEAAYFTEHHGKRGGTLAVQVNDASDIPRLAEPWFLTLNAEVELRIAMKPEDLAHANLEALGKQWA
jgi:hypothetical protein